MNDMEAEGQRRDLVFEYALDAPPEKVWRAITIPAFREKWLPEGDLADAKPIFTEPGEEIHYRLREDEAPFLESIVTFQIRPSMGGGTILKIVHGVVDARLTAQMPPAANNNEPSLMRAA